MRCRESTPSSEAGRASNEMRGSILFLAWCQLLMAACGALPEYRHEKPFIHPELQADVTRFHEIAGPGLYPVIEINIVALPLPKLGTCREFSDGTRRIYIDEKIGHTADDFRRDIVFHELVHCALGRMGHLDTGLMSKYGSRKKVEEEGGSEARLETYLETYPIAEGE
jgi:hypothetical protein